MKYFYFIILLLSFTDSFAAPTNKVIVNKGKWNSSNTWSLGRVPRNGDTVSVPSAYSVIVDNNVKLSTANIYLKVAGNIRFEVGKLELGAASIVEIVKDGSLTTKQGNPSDKIEIGSLLKYSGSQGTVSGPIKLSFGPTVILPVKFIGYNVTRGTNGVTIQWATSQEQNADVYIIERSEDGRDWRSVAYVAAIGNTNEISNYSFTDKTALSNTTYFRIKQVDIDGNFVYTTTKSIKTTVDTTIDVKVSATASNVVVELSKQIKGNIVVRLISLSGQVVSEQTYPQPSGYVIMNKASFKGNYVVSISNGQDVKIAKQVIL